jgi:hypothetical protein
MKIKVDEEEFYPWYLIVPEDTTHAIELEVSPETLERWQAAIEQAVEVQGEIRAAVRSGRNPRIHPGADTARCKEREDLDGSPDRGDLL